MGDAEAGTGQKPTSLITPDQIVSYYEDAEHIRMPTFEEFVWLYVHHNGRIHEIINKLNAGLQSSFRLSAKLLEEMAKMGVMGADTATFAPTLRDSVNDIVRVGDVATFVPARAGTTEEQHYFVISHPFETTTIQGKLSERGAQTMYVGSRIFATDLVKTLCLTHPDSGYVLVSLLGQSQIDWKKVAAALDFSRSQRGRMQQHEGQLDEALGMAPGKVTPLVPADKLPNLAAIVIDLALERLTSDRGMSRTYPYLEIPLNVESHRIREVRSLLMGVWSRNGAVDITGKRENGLAYNPKRHSLAAALETSYGGGKVLVADIAKSLN